MSQRNVRGGGLLASPRTRGAPRTGRRVRLTHAQRGVRRTSSRAKGRTWCSQRTATTGWRRMRRIVTASFFTGKVVRQHRSGWEDEAAAVVDGLRGDPAARADGVVLRRRLQLMMYNDVYRVMFGRRFEGMDDPLFVRLKELNGERSRLAQSFEYNYGDFIPILRRFLRGYLRICKERSSPSYRGASEPHRDPEQAIVSWTRCSARTTRSRSRTRTTSPACKPDQGEGDAAAAHADPAACAAHEPPRRQARLAATTSPRRARCSSTRGTSPTTPASGGARPEEFRPERFLEEESPEEFRPERFHQM
uniref:Uncharacterized protein n=1 Tax=Leersia perrieri TaxID=77586 RepID=A0A0D9V773_9ORYZ